MSRYERLVFLMKGFGKDKAHHNFYKLQIKSARQMDDCLSKAASYFYEAVSDFGYCFRRAFLWWIANIALGVSVIYFLVIARNKDVMRTYENNCIEVINDIGLSVLISLANSLPFLGLGKPIEGKLGVFKDIEAIGSFSFNSFRLISIFQGIMGPILFFFLLLTLRNKFKMR